MPGPPPKDPALRVRRNKATTKTTLARAPRAKKRALPRRTPAWHAETRRTWAAWWASPQAAEWTSVHVPRLYIIIRLHEDFNRAANWTDRKVLAAEIRLQEVDFGLTPLSQTKLQWSERHEEDDQAKKAKAAPPPPPPSGDPRLRLVRPA
jgi:hypothetical protein